MSERKLATIRKIAEIRDIEGADRIQAYRVDGWWVVGQKDQYKLDEMVVYCEIDSWIPTEIAPFLSKSKEPREFNGIKGERLKTIKLKGQVSQGLLLPIQTLEASGLPFEDFIKIEEEDNVSELLNITKWELSEKEFIRIYGQNKDARPGGFPSYIPKSDQERIQNYKTKTLQELKDKEIIFEVTEKLEGSSLTAYINGEDEGVCSRNINLKEPEDDGFNVFWHVARKYKLLEKLRVLDRPLAIQGELVGPGICGNIYKLGEYRFYLYNIWDISAQRWLYPDERNELCDLLEIEQVPFDCNFIIAEEDSIDDLLDMADGYSVINKEVRREGLVYKSYSSTHSFKTVSNKYLLEK